MTPDMVEKLRVLIAAKESASRDYYATGTAADYVAAVEASNTLKEWTGSYAHMILEHIERLDRAALKS